MKRTGMKVAIITFAVSVMASLGMSGCGESRANPLYNSEIGCVKNYYEEDTCPEGYFTRDYGYLGVSCLLACETDYDCADCTYSRPAECIDWTCEPGRSDSSDPW